MSKKNLIDCGLGRVYDLDQNKYFEKTASGELIEEEQDLEKVAEQRFIKEYLKKEMRGE